MSSSSAWALPPPVPAVEPGEAAVWLVEAQMIRPIEEVAARYLGVRPSSVVLRRSRAGKPELPDSTLRVGLAHSGEAALVAVASEMEVGVDVELLRPGTESWSLTSHALTPGERERLEALPAPERSEAFLSTWTRKEALLKAVGVGLALDPQLIELDGRKIVSAPPELGPPEEWTLVDVPLAGYAAALALRGPLARFLLYDARTALDRPTVS